MKKMKKCSKGFTLTELAVVIAVIAILIAVLVPTFISIIESANKTSDNLLVTNVNEVLSVDEAINGKPSNIDEALEIAEDGGFKVENLTTASEGTLIVWNETENEFIYVNSELDDNDNFVEVDGEAITSVASYNLWVITESYNSTYAAYSQYISGTITSLGVDTVSAGISVGDNADIDINYENSDGVTKSVTFVTKGGTLTVNDASATVYHYGTADEVVVTAVDSNSYHLHGEVAGNIELKKGHLVLESKATAAAVLVTAEKSSDISIENNSSNSASIPVAATDPDVASQLDTIVKGTGKSEVKTEATNEIALLYFESGLGTEEKPYMISTAQQFVNIYEVYLLDYTTRVYYKLANDISVTTNRYNVGDYKVASPWLYNAVLDGNNKTITLASNISLFYDVSISEINNLNCNITDSSLTVYAGAFSSGETIFNNVNVSGTYEVDCNNGAYVLYAYSRSTEGASVSFNSCTADVDMYGQGGKNYYNAVYVGYVVTGLDSYDESKCTYNYMTLNFTDCVNKGSLNCGKASMFLGNLPNSWMAQEGLKINVTNCTNEGEITSYYNGSDYVYNPYIAVGHTHTGTYVITCKSSEQDAGTTYTSSNIADAAGSISDGTGFTHVDNQGMAIAVNSDGTYKVTATTNTKVSYYIISVTIYSTLIAGGTSQFTVSQKIDAANISGALTIANYSFIDSSYIAALTDDGYSITTYTALTTSKNGEAATVYTINGVNYYYMNYSDCTLNGSVKAPQIVTISAYDADGNLLAGASI